MCVVVLSCCKHSEKTDSMDIDIVAIICAWYMRPQKRRQKPPDTRYVCRVTAKMDFRARELLQSIGFELLGRGKTLSSP